jgi:glycine dehydrogenase
MALQTREQHIRREKATSNICTAQVLLAVIAAFYAIYHGPKGIRRIATRVHRMAQIFAAGLDSYGYEIVGGAYFDTLTVRAPGLARKLAARANESGINLRIVDDDHLGISFDETIRRNELEDLWRVFAGQDNIIQNKTTLDPDALDADLGECIPESLSRRSAFLTHPVFNSYHSETEMMRYLRRLVSKDIALDRAMIPLGSCTMKLNASTEMQAISYREFAALHPFAPLEQTQGYQQLFEELEHMLCGITCFHAISLQPNAGSQGEYAGLLVIRKYHETRNEAQRNVCLIPASAHGTNPASAALAGMNVVVVSCNSNGNVDIEDLKSKAETHQKDLAALLITYPSTHGVFEQSIREICADVHKHGGQVYMDGANMNPMVGLCRPAELGVDVSPLNLHKTFCIPHGGGGLGADPIGVAEHLARFLPGHCIVSGVNPAAGAGETIGAVAAAPWGSASILTISWAYITMMGAQGLRRATEIAILNANYIATRLSEHYPILYTGSEGRVAHECIIDLRAIKSGAGITVDDVAKRLIDYGFHAPTMSFPVPDTMMIEPTESESKQELDRFCEAMIKIREEIAAVERGDLKADESPLANAPHCHDVLIAEQWPHRYSKQQAFFPLSGSEQDKYWPVVARIDNLHGDRQLICTCPPMDSYEQAS